MYTFTNPYTTDKHLKYPEQFGSLHIWRFAKLAKHLEKKFHCSKNIYVVYLEHMQKDDLEI